MRFCKVENGIVTNIIKADQSFIDTLSGMYIQDDNAKIGWELVNGVLIDPSPTPPPPTIEELIESKLNELKQYINNQKAAVESKYSDISIESFADKRKEALAWKVNNTAPTPYVDMMCTLPDGSIDATARVDLLNAILTKVAQVAQLEAYERSTRIAIEACTTQEELNAILIGG